MTIVFVHHDNLLQKTFLKKFKKTNKVNCFNEMYDAYKWMKQNDKFPNLVVTEVDLNDPTGLQSIKFLESKNRLKETNLVAFSNEKINQEQASFMISEGVDAVFNVDTLFTEVSSYIKFLELRGIATTKKPQQKN